MLLQGCPTQDTGKPFLLHFQDCDQIPVLCYNYILQEFRHNGFSFNFCISNLRIIALKQSDKITFWFLFLIDNIHVYRMQENSSEGNCSWWSCCVMQGLKWLYETIGENQKWPNSFEHTQPTLPCSSNGHLIYNSKLHVQYYEMQYCHL